MDKYIYIFSLRLSGVN